MEMRAIDCYNLGNVLRIFLSASEDLSDVHGEDWNDIGTNDPVYLEYVDGYIDFSYGFDKRVKTCDDYLSDSRFRTKEQMKMGLFPMAIIIDYNDILKTIYCDFERFMASKNVDKIYFGDIFSDSNKIVMKPEGENDHNWMFK